MMNFIKTHFHPLGERIIFWNIVLLVFVKIILPQASFQLANILDQIPQFDSREIISLTNEVRAQYNLSSLNSNFRLDAAATEKLNDMVKNGYFAHISPQGITPWFWVKKSNYNYTVAGENLAVGFFTAKDTLQAWFNSPSHRDNLLNSSYRDIGVAVGKGRLNGTEGIIVVQMFGSQKTRLVAQVIPTPLPKTSLPIQTAINISAPTPKPISSVLPAQTEIGLKYEISNIPNNQPVSTDSTIKATAGPIKVASNDKDNSFSLIQYVNITFVVYSFVFAIVSLLSFFLFNQKKMTAFQTLSHVGIFVLSIVITSAEISIGTFIF